MSGPGFIYLFILKLFVENAELESRDRSLMHWFTHQMVNNGIMVKLEEIFKNDLYRTYEDL